ncbi:MAG TPA: hypothetical protein PLF04_03090 [Candidatus Fermentibacter daniensis]|nr:MAG: hypothetical protein AO395_02940 [Candidatus Fermentibacter daniensis]MBP7720057.1 hypothetical protein [Candidatus Fermentibacter sp.]OQC70603.1 MAG: hypothetical protein BWX47_00274 [candidate division Hyd24-12 bacterium ADurb.Bin004]KZD19807.1 MAG: hypothetical protein AO394_01765 [Candidatus Fermentibacter daniensis]MCC6871807.1 hypothetical protein [Candidatus Fermentibacter sp.]
MKRLIPAAALVLGSVLLVLTAMPGSPGVLMRRAAGTYLDALGRGVPAEAHSLLTDSLAALVSEAGLSRMETTPSGSDPALGGLGRQEARGWPLEARGEEGGARILWLRQDGDRGWRIAGDTELDALMGSASVICRDYALSVVIPAAVSGTDPSSMSCPFSGQPYSLAGERLVCPARHLGEGLDIRGDECGSRRAEAAAAVMSWMGEGHGFPGSFEEIWEGSGGAIGLRGGYRCPVNGYSYYTLVDSGVWCPFHGMLTPVGPQ